MKLYEHHGTKTYPTGYLATISSSVAILAIAIIPAITNASFTDSANAEVTAQADVVDPPTRLNIRNARVGETDLTWTPTATEYVDGYVILRSANQYGPWSVVGSVQGRQSVSFTDKTGAGKQWIYRVEAKTPFDWVSTSPGFESPPAVGNSFYDDFTTAGDLDGKTTDDGTSVWQVWNGHIIVGEFPNGWEWGVQGSGYTDIPATAVVKTPSNSGRVLIADLDGSEGVVLRGKDPENFIYAGGSAEGDREDASFEIAKIENGIKTVLYRSNMGYPSRDMRFEIDGNVLKAYIDVTSVNPGNGRLFAEVNVDFLANDPTATFFGIAFYSDYLIRGFYFEAM